MDRAGINLRWCDALVGGLAASGVRHAVISPGSRSTPLALAFDRQAQIHTWVAPDERSAAFFALGLGKASSTAVALVGTSGSAPAHWLPAVVEASQDLQPLILISADRPAELQACGANQTLDQIRLFGQHARAFFQLPEPEHSEQALRHASARAARMVDQAHWPLPGPVHLNVPLPEPLTPKGDLPPPAAPLGPLAHPSYPRLTPDPDTIRQLARRIGGRPGLIVCGRTTPIPGLPQALTGLARRLDCPILADPLSGLRFGSHDRSLVLTRYDAFLRRPGIEALYRPDWVLHFGGLPTSRPLQEYLARIATDPCVAVTPLGPWPDPAHRYTQVLRADPLAVCEDLATQLDTAPAGPFSGPLVEQERRAASLLAGLESPPVEATVMAGLGNLPPEAILFCAGSMVIRDADGFLAGGPQPLTLVGNRGASGIDGNVSTSLGLASAGARPVTALLGDLALYHDMNGLLAAQGLDATLLVFNNGGGAIFDYLPQAGLPTLDRYWRTPTGLDPARVAQLYGLGHTRLEGANGLDQAMTASLNNTGVDLIELVIDPRESLKRHRAYWSAVAG
jgi:2-succinyl-5-enolpyruvyl-6-hydroxy-3-cyclohexene-1-carboxylate synthase